MAHTNESRQILRSNSGPEYGVSHPVELPTTWTVLRPFPSCKHAVILSLLKLQILPYLGETKGTRRAAKIASLRAVLRSCPSFSSRIHLVDASGSQSQQASSIQPCRAGETLETLDTVAESRSKEGGRGRALFKGKRRWKPALVSNATDPSLHRLWLRLLPLCRAPALCLASFVLDPLDGLPEG